jgi:hypothetical protein
MGLGKRPRARQPAMWVTTTVYFRLLLIGSFEGIDSERGSRADGPRTSAAARPLSNASLVLPGVTCTIVVAPEYASAAFDFRFDGRQLRLRGKGTHECDLTSIGMGKPMLGWDVDVDVPVFIKK